MLEFLISRTMLAVMGVAVIGLAVSGIVALDEGHTVSMQQRIADDLAMEIARIPSIGGHVVFVLRVDDYLPAGDWSIELTNDTVAVIHATTRCTAATGCPVLIEGGRRTATAHGTIVVECPYEGNKVATVYVVNVEDMSWTASTNVLQSCKLL
ncbi:MAG: hypothetical protein LUO79_00275 [Methanomassiliicoccales archaeon]|nr:hypothetical protein [Methanomassiliicoccales archaeon]